MTVLGGSDMLEDYLDAQVVICAGKGSARQAIAARLGLPPERYATIVHPSVSLPKSCEVGVGTILLAGCVATTSVTLGRHVVVMPHVTLTHDDVIGDYATVCAGVCLGGAVSVGAGAYLGMACSVRENVRIGRGAVVGMGAAVLQDVPDDEVWVGVPARRAAPIRTTRSHHQVPTMEKAVDT